MKKSMQTKIKCEKILDVARIEEEYAAAIGNPEALRIDAAIWYADRKKHGYREEITLGILEKLSKPERQCTLFIRYTEKKPSYAKISGMLESILEEVQGVFPEARLGTIESKQMRAKSSNPRKMYTGVFECIYAKLTIVAT